ncbi:fibronectin type III domain containing 3A, partial [Monoraphidium neglectum]
MTVPASEDPRQLEVQQLFTYSVPHELQMQEVAVSGPASGDALMQQALSMIVEKGWMKVLEAPCCNAEVTALRPGRYYAVRICCTPVAMAPGEPAVVFPSQCSQLQVFRTVPTPPGPMQAPALSQRARNALKLKWTLPDETGGEPILQYVLQMQPSPLSWEGMPNTEGFFEVYSGDERSFKVVKLAPGMRYTFRIMAYNTLGPSPWSLCSAFSTQASVPSAPEPPVQVASSSDSVTLQWTAPPDNGAAISGYTLEVDDGRGGDFRLAYTGSNTKATVEGLQSGLPFRFRLQADNIEGRSFWSTPAVATTAATAPSIPGGLGAISVSCTSVTLAWQPPAATGGSPVTGYEVQLQATTRAARDVLGDDWLIIYDGPSTATTFSALQPGCSYMARVSARNKAGRSSFSIATQFTSAPDAPAAPLLQDADVDSTSLLLKWQPPPHDGGSPIASYRVEMRCSPSQANGGLDEASVSPQHSLALTPHYLTIYNGAECCVQVTDLMPGTTYQFRVMAINGQGGSPWSSVGSATTLPSVPLPPAAPAVSACSSHSLHLSWREPYGQGSPVTSYTVNMARLPTPRHAAANGHGHAASVSGDSEHSSADMDAEAAAASCSVGGEAQQRLRYETVYTGPALSCEVRNLEPATTYSLRVRAHNAMGGSLWGDTATLVTAAAAPGPPGSLAVAAASAGELHVSWSPPLRDHGSVVSAYLLEMAAGGRGGAGSMVGGAGGKAGGGGGGSSKAGSSQAWSKVRWTLPAEENGAPLTGYVLQSRPVGSTSGSSGGDPFADSYVGMEMGARVTGLEPGTSYELRVAARNRVGQSPWSEMETAATALRPPTPPTSVAAVVNTGPPLVLRVSWATPADDPGGLAAEAVGYEVEALSGTAAPSGGGGGAALRQQVGRVETASLVGLSPGCTYTVHLRAVGAGGSGHSAWSESVRISVPAAASAAAAPSAVVGESSGSGDQAASGTSEDLGAS